MQSLAATAVLVEGKSCATVWREEEKRYAFAEKKKRGGEPVPYSARYS